MEIFNFFYFPPFAPIVSGRTSTYANVFEQRQNHVFWGIEDRAKKFENVEGPK